MGGCEDKQKKLADRPVEQRVSEHRDFREEQEGDLLQEEEQADAMDKKRKAWYKGTANSVHPAGPS